MGKFRPTISSKVTTKSPYIKYKIFFGYLIIALIAFELRGFIPFTSIIPYTWPLKITEKIIAHTKFTTPFISEQKCENFNDVVRIMGKSFPKHSYGQAEFYSVDLDPTVSIEPVVERGVAYDENGIVKWRYKDNEPYIAFELAGNWTIHYDNDGGKEVSVQTLSDALPALKERMESHGFTVSTSNDIPLYRYPDGSYARKIGFSKGNYLYHFTILEESISFDSELSTQDIGSNLQKPVRVSMNCAENSPELRTMYEQYLSIPHEFTTETTIVYSGRKDNLARFTLYFPGGVLDQVLDEYYDIRQQPIRLVSATNNFTLCSVFEKENIGNGTPCYRPEVKEFSEVNYQK